MSRSVVPLRKSAIESTLKLAAFNQQSVPALCANEAGQILATNAAFATLLGRPAEQLVGGSLFDLAGGVRGDRLLRRWARLWQYLEHGDRAGALLRWPADDGHGRLLLVEAQRLRIDDDKLVSIGIREVTAERAARRAQRARQLRVALLARAGSSPAFLLGGDRRVIAHNAAAQSIKEDPAIEFPGLPFDYLIEGTSGAQFRREFARLLTMPGESVRRELRLRQHAEGGGRWFECTLENRLHEPAVAGVLATVRDVNELRYLKQRLRRLERRLRAFTEYAADLLMVVDEAGVIRYQSPAALRLLGVDADTTVGQPVTGLFAAEDQPVLAGALQAARRDTHAHGCRVRLPADGAPRQFLVTVVNLAHDPAIGGLLLTAREVGAAAASGSDARQARRLRFRERLLELAMQPRGDLQHSLSRLLRAATEALQVSAASFWQHNPQASVLKCESMFVARKERFAHDWIGVEFPGSLYPSYLARLRERQPLAIRDLATAPDLASLPGHRRWSAVRAMLDAPVLIDGDVHGVLSLHHDAPRDWDEDDLAFATTAALLIALAMEAAQRQEAESRIEQLAWYDPLTGLPNRNLLRETVRDLVLAAANGRRRIALLLIDLDRFKDVNDTLGHLVGDALIKSAAQLLRDTVGDRGVVGRLGGDEFVVVLNDFEHRQEVSLFAARIAQLLHRTDLVPNVDTQVSASIGIALFPEHGREMSTLMKNADSAMYQAKRDGRNQFSFFNPIRYEHAAREVQLGIQLLKALQGGAVQFFVEYQPLVQMTTGRVVGLEALIRWQHPTYGRLTPDRFVGVAEVSGLSERITRWLVNEVCAQILRWRAKQPGFDIPIAINIAGRELGSASLPMIVRSAFEQHGVEPRMISLEITERTLVKENEVNNDVMAELASVGVGLVLDDFGTGYSTLGYLKRMPIQALKIDGSFIEGVPGDADSCAIVHAVLAVARHFKLKVVAEGIETAEQVEYLRTVGCEYAQGFYYSRPLPPQTILEYIDIGPSDPPTVPLP